MRYRTLGDVRVSAVGLGAMPLSIEGRPDEARAVATVHAALDADVTLLDTADSYHLPGAEPGHNERLVARALATYGGDTANVLVATKGGRGRPADGGWTVNGSPRHLKPASAVSASNGSAWPGCCRCPPPCSRSRARAARRRSATRRPRRTWC